MGIREHSWTFALGLLGLKARSSGVLLLTSRGRQSRTRVEIQGFMISSRRVPRKSFLSTGALHQGSGYVAEQAPHVDGGSASALSSMAPTGLFANGGIPTLLPCPGHQVA